MAALRHLRTQAQAQRQRYAEAPVQDDVHGCSGGSSAKAAAVTALPPLLFLTDMQAGHFASSGASDRLEQWAQKVAFLLHALGVEGEAGGCVARAGDPASR